MIPCPTMHVHCGGSCPMHMASMSSLSGTPTSKLQVYPLTMSDDNKIHTVPPQTETTTAVIPQEGQAASQQTPGSVDRTELLQTARAFLNSPQVRHEDNVAKRNFLAQKGLNDAEIDILLREVVRAHGRPSMNLHEPRHDLCVRMLSLCKYR